MNVQKQLITPDHNFSPGSRHYLIPYVYKIFEFIPDYKVGSDQVISHEGKMKIVIRAGWWEKEHAYQTACDLAELFDDPSFYQWTRKASIHPNTGQTIYYEEDIKPILILQTDNAANFSPKYKRVQEVMYYLFKFNVFLFIFYIFILQYFCFLL